jgi:single-strand DNA-binding protein
MNWNNATQGGRLTADPIIRKTGNGTAVANFTIANNRRYKDSEGKKIEESFFIDVTFFGKTAENIEKYLKKGDPVLVQGYLKLDTWEKDGKKGSKIYIRGEKMQLVKSKSEGSGNSTATEQDDDPFDDSEVPF